jgi:serine/threonine protein kinase
MGSGLDIALWIGAGVLGIALVVAIVLWVIVPLAQVFGRFFRRVGRFLLATFKDLGRLLASVLVAPVFGVLALLSLMFLQTKAATKFGRALADECVRFGVTVYQLFLGNPMRLAGLETALEGIETRLPSALTGTWGEVVSPRDALFPGYTILSTLPAGGSGAKLYIAEPGKAKLREIAKHLPAGMPAIDRVVLKSFSTLHDEGLPSIVRESRAMEAGTRLGLILDHGFGTDRFFYATRFIPGQNLRFLTTQWHRECGPRGLDDAHLRRVLGVTHDLVSTLRDYHELGVWHKDVKPDNIILEASDGPRQGKAQLVDLGLVTSLRSAMTLTTHGTEYYRDPELVRQALRGVRVQDVDGSKFDVYAAGAVFFSMLEDSFPAQGVLTPMTKRCPPAAAWIVRRAMADYAQRYITADEMLGDIAALEASQDLFAMKPFELPSMRRVAHEDVEGDTPQHLLMEPGVAAKQSQQADADAASPLVRNASASLALATTHPQSLSTPSKPRVRVLNWITGRYVIDDVAP